jgi:hypothetical protein
MHGYFDVHILCTDLYLPPFGGLAMKLINRFIQRIEVVAFILGGIVGIYMLVFAPYRYFFMWHALPLPPEAGEEMLMTNHMGDVVVRTITNKMFRCNIYDKEACWFEQVTQYPPFDGSETLCFEGNCPDEHTVQMRKVSAALHGFGEPSTIYSLRDNGMVFVKQTGVIYWPGYVVGAVLGGICAFIAFTGKNLLIGIISLFQRKTIK